MIAISAISVSAHAKSITIPDDMDAFKQAVLDNKKPVLVDFYAQWCSNCRIMKPMIEDLAKKLDDKIDVVTVDSTHSLNVAKNYHVFGLPTYVKFVNGKRAGQIVGAGYTEASMEKWMTTINTNPQPNTAGEKMCGCGCKHTVKTCDCPDMQDAKKGGWL